MRKNNLENRFHNSLVDASHVLNSNDQELVSIKIRPINIFPKNDEDEFFDAYVYFDDYNQIQEYLENETLINKTKANNNFGKIYQNRQAENFIYIQHETGPEIIANLALLTASVTLAKSVIDLIIVIIKSIDESNEKKKKNEVTNRYHQAEAITIEKRTQKETKTIKIKQLPITEIEIENLKNLIKEI